MFALIGCSTTNKTTSTQIAYQSLTDINDIEGTWVLKNVLMGDAMDVPCGFMNEGKVKEMNLTFTAEKVDVRGQKKLYGRSSVNDFIGGYTILSYDSTTKTGKIKLDPFVSTRMASVDPTFMNCENRYFSYLEKSEDFKIENGKLQLSKTYPLVKGDTVNFPFGESYKNVLYFYKK